VIWLSAISRKSSKVLDKTRSNDPTSREYLVKTIKRAKRKGCYYSVLKQFERRLLDLTVRVVERVRSFVLAKLISQIVSKLLEAMESRVYRLMRTEGRSLAEQLSKIAQSWGNRSAKSWVNDRGFMQYLTVSSLGSFGAT
jgi:hypothetical protein